MPLYGTFAVPAAVWPGDIATIVNAEQLGANGVSERIAIGRMAGFAQPVSVSFAYASTPAAVAYDIQVANEDIPASYIKIGSTNNVNGDRVDINTLAGGLNFNFIRVVERTSPGVAATVKILG